MAHDYHPQHPQHSPPSYMPLPMPLPLPPPTAHQLAVSPAIPPSTADPSDESAYVSDDDEVDDDDDDKVHDAVPAPATAPAPMEQGPRMVSRAVQAGGVDQGTQVDFPCPRCVSSQHHNYNYNYYNNQHHHQHHQHHQQQHNPYAAYPPYHYPPPPPWQHSHSMPQPAVQGQGPQLAPAPGHPPPPPLPPPPLSRPPNPFLPPPGSTPQAPVSGPLITPAPALPQGPMTWDAMVLRRTWANVEDAEEDIKNLAESLGFALIRRRSGNIDPDTGKPTRIQYSCHLDAARSSHLERNPESRKRKRESATGAAKRSDPCPWQICLRWNRQRRDRPDLYRMWHLVWTTGDDIKFRTHNHPMDPDPANIPANRRRHMTQEVKDQILGFVAQRMSAAEVVRAMKEANPRLKLTKSAVDNMRRADVAEKKKAEEAAAAAEADGSGEGNADGGEAGLSSQAAETSQATPATGGHGTAPATTTEPEAMAVAAMAGLAHNTPSRPPRIGT